MAIARRLVAVLIILTALAGSLGYFSAALGLQQGAQSGRNTGWAVFAVISVLSIFLIVLIWHSLRRSLRRIKQQIHQFESQGRIGMIMIDSDDELAELVGMMNRYLTGLKLRFESDRAQQKELQLQAGAAEAECRKTEAIILGICQAVLVIDQYGELLLANAPAERLFQFDIEKHRHCEIEDVVDDTELLDLIRQTAGSCGGQTVRMFKRLSPDGSRMLSLKVLLSCIQDATGRAIGVVVVIHDMTAERELADMKDDFLSSVSHELKTPLSSVRACAEMLLDNEASDRHGQEKMCKIILEQSHRLNSLIDDILNTSSLESGMFVANFEPVDLSELLGEVLDAVRPQAAERKINLIDQIDPSGLAITADRELLYQVVANLLSNAIKYTAERSDVYIRTGTADGRMVTVEVIDQGPGIPQELEGRIFEKFYRMPSSKHLVGGTGLGLHLVREIVERIHLGRVELDSSPGDGSTFRICLPQYAEVEK